MRNTGLDEAQAEIKIAGRNVNNLRYADDTIRMAESEEELKGKQDDFSLKSAVGFCSGHVMMSRPKKRLPLTWRVVL